MESVGTLTGLSMDAMITRLRDVALYAHLHRITLANLTTGHLNIFHGALLRTLGFELARDTFAQIFDGLPIADVAWDKRHLGIFGDDHPIEAHATLCPGVNDKTFAYLQQHDLHSLAFDPKIFQAYQIASLGSKAFHTCLIELVVTALHQIAVDLFKRDNIRSHSQQEIDALTNCVMVPPTSPAVNPEDFMIYPDGIADTVGYWAEDGIVGVIVLFDRRAGPRHPHTAGDHPNEAQDGEETGRNAAESPPNIWLHPSRDHVTDRICQLREDQQKALVDYLTAPGDTSSPLPILPDKGNRTRVDPSIAHSHKFIFRDYWDRKPATQELLDFLVRRPQNELDYPEIRDVMDRVNALQSEFKKAKNTQNSNAF